MKQFSKKSGLASLEFILILTIIAGIAASITLSRQNQDLRNYARCIEIECPCGDGFSCRNGCCVPNKPTPGNTGCDCGYNQSGGCKQCDVDGNEEDNGNNPGIPTIVPPTTPAGTISPTGSGNVIITIPQSVKLQTKISNIDKNIFDNIEINLFLGSEIEPEKFFQFNVENSSLKIMERNCKECQSQVVAELPVTNGTTENGIPELEFANLTKSETYKISASAFKNGAKINYPAALKLDGNPCQGECVFMPVTGMGVTVDFSFPDSSTAQMTGQSVNNAIMDKLSQWFGGLIDKINLLNFFKDLPDAPGLKKGTCNPADGGCKPVYK